MREAVVLIHGIWMVGWEMGVLRRRLERCNLVCYPFRYHSLSLPPEENAVRLNTFINKIEADIIHLLAHSLGGIIVLHLFDKAPIQKPGRILMLGTPLNGSALAARLYKTSISRPLLGRSAQRGLLGDVPPWNGGRELGMIAGDRGMGLGSLLFGTVETPNDGTVSVAETRSHAVDVHLTVPYSHMGMLWSPRVAEAACQFLREGHF